jgi:hypothetical protein
MHRLEALGLEVDVLLRHLQCCVSQDSHEHRSGLATPDVVGSERAPYGVAALDRSSLSPQTASASPQLPGFRDTLNPRRRRPPVWHAGRGQRNGSRPERSDPGPSQFAVWALRPNARLDRVCNHDMFCVRVLWTDLDGAVGVAFRCGICSI